MLKNSKKVSNFQFLCIVQVTGKSLGFVLVSKWHQVARKQQFCKMYGHFLC